MPKLKVGDRAPEFSLPARDACVVSLKDFRNQKNVVLYFYPKDDTPGCTIEACGFRDAHKDIEKVILTIHGSSEIYRALYKS